MLRNFMPDTETVHAEVDEVLSWLDQAGFPLPDNESTRDILSRMYFRGYRAGYYSSGG